MQRESDMFILEEAQHSKRSHFFRYVLPILFVIGALAVGIAVRKSSIYTKPADKLVNKHIPFELVESSPSHFATGFPVTGEPTFVFSKPLDIEEKDLPTYFHISPSLKGSWKLEKNRQVVSFTSDQKLANAFPTLLNFDTVYHITVNKGIRAASGEKIANDTDIMFRTKRATNADLNTNYKLVDTHTDQPVKIELYYDNYGKDLSLRSDSIHATVYEASLDQVIQYFTRSNEDRWNLLYFFDKKPDQHEIMSFDAKPYGTDTYGSRSYIDIPALGKTGLYYVRLSDSYGSDDLIVNVSNHINQVFFDRSDMRVWATNAEGVSLPNITTTLYSVKDRVKELSSGTTDTNGLYKNINDPLIDFVVTRMNDASYALSYVDRYTDFTTQRLSVYAYTDRPVYKPGNTVHSKAIIRDNQNNSYVVPSGTIYYRYLDYLSDLKKTEYKELKIDENGTVTVDIELPKETQGSPRLVYYTKNKGEYSEIYTQELVIEPYQKPDLDITAMTTEKEYISKDTAHITVLAKTLYGQPFNNIAFTYRVLANSYYEVKDRKYEQIADSYSYYGYGEDLANGEGTFDKKGKAEIAFSTDLKAFEKSQLITVEITPKIGAAPSIGKIVKLIHRGEFAIFFDNVKGTTEDGISADILALDHSSERRPYADPHLEVSLYRVHNYSQKDLLTTQSATVDQSGKAHLTFPYKEKGDYLIVTTGKDARDNTIRETYTVYIGTSYTYEPPTETAYLDLSTKENSYKPGSTATVLLNATFPLKDVAIITTGSTGYMPTVNNFEIRKSATQTVSITVPISKTASGVIGVNAYTIYKGAVVEARTQISVETGANKLQTAVTFDKSVYKPGDSVKAQVQTSDASGNPIAADTSLSVIDSAILQIVSLQGSMFDSFYSSSTYPSYISHFDSLSGIYTQRGGGGGGCFLNGTRISMAGNAYKPIEDIIPGDKILTFESPSSHNLIEDTVTKTYRHVVDEYLTINGTLNITAIHRLYVNHQWKTAGELHRGDTLLNESGDEVIVRSIEHHSGQFTVYNLTTSKTHTFIAEGIYVHNDKGYTPRQNFVDTAYWNPHIMTGADGKASVTFKLPDNVTTFTAQVKANTKTSQFGEAESEFISKKDVVIIPAQATFYFMKDQPVVSAIIQNNSSTKITGKMSLLVKELGKTQQQDVQIDANDFSTVSFPVELDTNKEQVHMIYELKADSSGAVLDSVQIAQQLVPREDIYADWFSHVGSFSQTFSPKHPMIDVNSMIVNVVPHLSAALLRNNYHNFSDFYSYNSTSEAFHIYAASYILAQAKSGAISPSVFTYAMMKNNLRDTIQTILAARSETPTHNIWWTRNDSYTKESNGLYSTAMTLSLKEALHNGILDQISNASDIVQKAQTAIANHEVPLAGTEEESILLRWLLGYGDGEDCVNAYKTSCYASKAIHGDKKALDALRSLTVPSSDDRYFWTTSSVYTQGLPALAMVMYGSSEDADKAIKGLSFQYGIYSYYGDVPYLAIAAAVRHAIRQNLDVNTPIANVSINNIKMKDWSDDTMSTLGYEGTFRTIDKPDGKVSVNVTSKEGLPLYSTVSYTEMRETPANEGNAHSLTTSFERAYRSPADGTLIQKVAPGTAAIIELRITNPITNLYDDSQLGFASYKLYDMIPPGFMYLNQSSDNSPEYQSQLNSIYPDVKPYQKSYITVSDYTDQSVYYDGYAPIGLMTMPYIGYRITDGVYYRPKTTLVFPLLGIIAHEH